MSTKTTGAEWKRFYLDPEFWPEGWWHEDEEVSVDGILDESANLEAVPDEAVMIIAGGMVIRGANDFSQDGPSLEGHFKKWQKKQNTLVFAVEVSREKAQEVRDAIESAGGKLLVSGGEPSLTKKPKA